MINFLNLKYFVRVAEERNITRVAEQEHISQQSLSSHIKKIEEEYGVKLFDRTDGFTLTYAGEKLYIYATNLLSLKNDLDNELSDITGTKQGSLKIGISYTRGTAFLPEILPEFCKKNPFVNVSISENNSQVLEEFLLHGHIDLYVGTDLNPHPEIETIELYQEELYFVVPKKLLGNISTDTLTFSDIFHFPFLLLSKGNKIRDTFDEYAISKKHLIKPVLETENIETLLELSCSGMGVTVYPEMFFKRHSHLNNSPDSPVRIITMNESRTSILSIGYRKNRYLSRAAKEFINLAKTTLTEKS